MSANEPKLRLTLQGENEISDALASLALARFVSGQEPFAESFTVQGIGRAIDVLPLGAARWHAVHDREERVLARGDGWTALVQRWANGNAHVDLTASDPETLAKAVAEVRARLPVVEPRTNQVEIDFWHGYKLSRTIDAPPWDTIEAHYPASVRAALATLVALDGVPPGGRLLLWHGPPGTGKTTAIRALAQAWSAWCRTLYVADAERFLGDASYLMNVVLGGEELRSDDDGDAAAPRWRLLIFEDADELLRADAKRAMGQSLSRLLNLSDGFIGQGVNVLVLITTNEPLGSLHPAVVRPGRCLAEVEFGPLSQSEAQALIGTSDPAAAAVPAAAVPAAAVPAGGLTLAEVFERRGQLTTVRSRRDAAPVGQYL